MRLHGECKYNKIDKCPGIEMRGESGNADDCCYWRTTLTDCNECKTRNCNNCEQELKETVK